MSGALGPYLSGFVDATSGVLQELSGQDHTPDCLIEADNIVSAVFDSDERLTDAELEAWLADVGSALTPPVFITPGELRETDLITGRSDWLDRPSTMLDLLIKADARDRGRRTIAYYESAMKLAHAAAAVDLVPSPGELAAIDRFRTTLLTAIDSAGLARPGQPQAQGSSGDVKGAPSAGVGGAVAPDEAPPARPTEEILAELDGLIGLDHVKTEVRRLTSLIRVQQLRAEQDLPVIETSRHLVFVGNPGTGKTTVARLLSELYRSLGVVTRGQLVETDRSDLVAGYVGQTAAKTRTVLERALGGTLLIDEAYALARGGENDFGLEAIDTLVKFMEDHRDDLAVVVAGYPSEMQQLIESNPGLESRFARTLEFPDYTSDELVAIFDQLAKKNEYHLTPGGADRLREVIDTEPRERGFGNARFVRNVFEQAVGMQAVRLADVKEPTSAQLTTLDASDIAPV